MRRNFELISKALNQIEVPKAVRISTPGGSPGGGYNRGVKLLH